MLTSPPAYRGDLLWSEIRARSLERIGETKFTTARALDTHELAEDVQPGWLRIRAANGAGHTVVSTFKKRGLFAIQIGPMQAPKLGREFVLSTPPSSRSALPSCRHARAC